MKLQKTYKEDSIEFYFEKEAGKIVSFSSWIDHNVDTRIYNVLNDFLVNGIAENIKNKIVVKNEDLKLFEEEDFTVLELPKFYPFDIFISLKGSGLKDKNGVLDYSFQDNSNKNGTGNIIFKKTDRKGVLLENNKASNILNAINLKAVQAIDQLNITNNLSEKERLIAIANIQDIASKSDNIYLSRILSETIILNPETCKLSIQKVAEDKYRLTPEFKGVNQAVFDKKFNLLNRVKDEYSYSEKGKKIRVLISNPDGQEGIKSELEKIKKQKTYSKEEISEMVETPSKFWNTDLLDLDDFGNRVAELGIYKPKFYPFISPYKSQWIPGIAIEDVINGTRLVSIDSSEELDNLKENIEVAKSKNEEEIFFKGEFLDIDKLQSVVDVAEKQLSQPKTPIIPNKKIKKKK